MLPVAEGHGSRSAGAATAAAVVAMAPSSAPGSRTLGAVGRTMLARGPGSAMYVAASPQYHDDGSRLGSSSGSSRWQERQEQLEADDVLWAHEMRAAIKATGRTTLCRHCSEQATWAPASSEAMMGRKSGRRQAPSPTFPASPVRSPVFGDGRSSPLLRAAGGVAKAMPPPAIDGSGTLEEMGSEASEPLPQEVSAAEERRIEAAGALALDRARREAQAKSAACFEDLIGFLELHELSGAYALVLSGNGVENLSQLLMLEEDGLNDVLQHCDFEPMDEILFRDALRKSKIHR